MEELEVKDRIEGLIKQLFDQAISPNPLIKEASKAATEYVSSMATANRMGSRFAVCLNNIAIQASKAKSTTHDLAIAISEIAEAHRMHQHLRNELMSDFERFATQMINCAKQNDQRVASKRKEYADHLKTRKAELNNLEKLMKKSARSKGGLHETNKTSVEEKKQEIEKWRQSFLKETLMLERQSYTSTIEVCMTLVDEEVQFFQRTVAGLINKYDSWQNMAKSAQELSGDAMEIINAPLDSFTTSAAGGDTGAAGTAPPSWGAAMGLPNGGNEPVPSYGSQSYRSVGPEKTMSTKFLGKQTLSDAGPNRSATITSSSGSGFGGSTGNVGLRPPIGGLGPRSIPGGANSAPSSSPNSGPGGGSLTTSPNISPLAQISSGSSHSETAKALYDYTAQDSTGLSIRQGDLLTLDGDTRDGWIYAKLNGQGGWIPETYVSKPNADSGNLPPSTYSRPALAPKPPTSGSSGHGKPGGPLQPPKPSFMISKSHSYS